MAEQAESDWRDVAGRIWNSYGRGGDIWETVIEEGVGHFFGDTAGEIAGDVYEAVSDGNGQGGELVKAGQGELGSLGHPYEIQETVVEAERTPMAEGTFPPGTIISFRGQRWKVQPDGSLRPYSRRRRKRMLTCSDRADIAFLKGQLGTGALGQSAISALLTSCGR